MRIAIIVPGGVGADGVHAVIPALLALIGRLAGTHDVLVVAIDQAARPARYELRGARVVCVGTRRRGSVGRARAGAAALRELRRFRPDVIHAIWLGSGSSVAIVAGWLLRVPVVASIGGGELVAIPRIRYGGLLRRRGRFHAWLALHAATAVTAGSRFALGPVWRRRPDARWLPLGAERPGRSAAADDGATSSLLRLLVVANVNRVKGPEAVLGALARIRRDGRLDVHLDWIGEDTLGGRSEELGRSLGLSGIVTFHGFVPHDGVLAWMDRADLLVQGSQHESQGVAVLEAAMRGVPTVGTSVGLVPELAALEPPAAVAAPVGDAGAIAAAIEVLAADPQRRVGLGEAARAWALAHDAAWSAAAFEAVYAEAIGRVARGRRA